MERLKRIEYNSPVVLTFAIISFAVLLLGQLTGGMTNMLLFTVYRSNPLDIFYWLRLFGHVLGHANLQHYTNNILLILLLGPMLEEKYGSRRLLMMIGMVAVLTGLVNVALFPHTALLGASGIVFMMMILSSVTGMKQGKIPLTLIVVIVIYLGQEVLSGITVADNISRLTHIVGGLCGGGFGMYFSRNGKKE